MIFYVNAPPPVRGPHNEIPKRYDAVFVQLSNDIFL